MISLLQWCNSAFSTHELIIDSLIQIFMPDIEMSPLWPIKTNIHEMCMKILTRILGLSYDLLFQGDGNVNALVSKSNWYSCLVIDHHVQSQIVFID